MSDNSKIIFVSTDTTGTYTCQQKLDNAYTNGDIDKGDIAILEDTMKLIYITMAGVQKVFPFSEATAPKTFDSIASVIPADLSVGELIAVKSGNVYNMYVCGTDSSGGKEVKKLALDDDVADKLATINNKITTDEGKLATAEGDIAALKGDMTTAKADVVGLKADVTTAKADIVALKAAVAGTGEKDWEVNDTTSTKFIKNRTHYVKADGTVEQLDNKFLKDDLEVKNTIKVGTGTASGEKSMSVGTLNTVTGVGAFGSGYKVEAKGVASHAEGYGSKANSMYGHAEGRSTSTGGRSSHAEGEESNAIGDYSHAEGQKTTTNGLYSHAEGYGTVAFGNGSHAEGIGTIANGTNQHVFGKYNATNGTDVEIVGYGTSATTRKNIRTLDQSGNETLAGTLTVGSAPTNANHVATKKYVDDKIEGLDVTDAEVLNQYVSAVSETDGLVAVTRKELPVYSVAKGTGDGTVKINGVDQAITGYADLSSKTTQNTSAIDVLNGNDASVGSVANSVKKTKDVLETEIGALTSLQTTNKSNLVAAINETFAAIGSGSGTASVLSIVKQPTPDAGYQTTYNVSQGGSSVGKISTKDHEYSTPTTQTQVSVNVNNSTNIISAELVDGGVATSKLANTSVTSDKIADTAVTKTKLATAIQTTLDKVGVNETNIGTLSTLTTSNKTSLVNSINSLKTDLDTAKTDLNVTLEEAAGSGDILKTYTVKRGGTSIGVISLAKSLVVKSGSVVNNPTGQAPGKYIELVLSDTASTKVYINVADLANQCTVQADAPIVQLSIDGNNEISATIKSGSVDLSKLAASVQTSIGKADTSVQTIATGTANGSIKVDGTDIPVKGLGSAAYTEASAYDVKDAAKTVKTELLGAASDSASATTIFGVKKYAETLNDDMDTRVSALEAGGGGGGGGGDVTTAINALNVSDTPIAGKYVSAVNEVKGKIRITREDFPEMSGAYIPTGTVASSFTGTGVSYTPAGTVSTPTVTVTPTTTTVTGISTVGTLPTCTLPVLQTSVTNGLLKINWTAGSYTNGTLPTKETSAVVLTGVSATASTPTFVGINATITPVGDVSSTFTGTNKTITVRV